MLGCIMWFLVVGGRLAVVWYQMPGLVRINVSGKQMDMGDVKRWKEAWNQEKREPEIIGATGWRWENQGELYAPDTGRRAEAEVLGVCGGVSEQMSCSGRLLAGGLGLAKDGSCIVSEALALELFGSCDVTGSRVRLGNKTWEIAGVVEGREKRLLVPVTEGNADWVEVWVDGRKGRRDITIPLQF